MDVAVGQSVRFGRARIGRGAGAGTAKGQPDRPQPLRAAARALVPSVATARTSARSDAGRSPGSRERALTRGRGLRESGVRYPGRVIAGGEGHCDRRWCSPVHLLLLPATPLSARPPRPYTPVLIDARALRARPARRASRATRCALLRDAAENYPAWLDAIRAARAHDPVRELHRSTTTRSGASSPTRSPRGRARACGCASSTTGSGSRGLGARSGDGAASTRAREVRVLQSVPARQPARLAVARPSQDDRDRRSRRLRLRRCASARSGCGDPARRLEPWRDTGIEIRGPAVAELERAFAQVWHVCGGDAAAPRAT